ncbi:MAG TPA: hypothetical protein VN688_15210 [Gemmataceae bacterium]|nr:hypothetical protein [Gemmataceae bacterium]
MERKLSSDISKNEPPTRQGLQVSPSAPVPGLKPDAFTLPRSRRTLYRVLVAIGLVVAGIAAAVIVGVWKSDHYIHDSYFRSSGDVPEVVPTEKQVVERFKTLKNAGDPVADELLAPLAAVPVEPISQEEADRFKVNCFLHQNIHIQSVRAVASNRFILATEGNLSTPPLQVRSAKGADRIQHILFNPDLIVEVRDGIIHGVR